MTCPHQPGCALGHTFHTAPALRVWQTFYCESGFQRCARLTLLRSGNLVPVNLLPNGTFLQTTAPGARTGPAKRP